MKSHAPNPMREAARAAARTIAKMTPDERAAIAARMPVVTVEGRALSMFNACLIATQLPTATIVGGFRQWLAAGRCVVKGQHGLWIWIPVGHAKEGEAGNDEARFMLAPVFDVSQTAELPADAERPATRRARDGGPAVHGGGGFVRDPGEDAADRWNEAHGDRPHGF